MLETIQGGEVKLQELTPEEKQKTGILGRLVGPIASYKKATRNGRKYTEPLWEKVFQSKLVKEMFNNGGLIGQLEHPKDTVEYDPEKTCILMRDLPKKDKNGILQGSVDILDTPCGRIAYALAKAGFRWGISSRGEGDIEESWDGESVVNPDTYQLSGFDLVALPACEDARLTFIESLNKPKFDYKTYIKESYNNATDEQKQVMMETCNNYNLDIDLDEGCTSEEDLNLDEINEEENPDAQILKETFINGDIYSFKPKKFVNKVVNSGQSLNTVREDMWGNTYIIIMHYNDLIHHSGADDPNQLFNLDVIYEDRQGNQTRINICDDEVTAQQAIECLEKFQQELIKERNGWDTSGRYKQGKYFNKEIGTDVNTITDESLDLTEGISDMRYYLNAIRDGIGILYRNLDAHGFNSPAFEGTRMKIDNNLNKAIELARMNESVDISENNKAVDNNEAMFEELQEALKQNKDLKATVVKLNEQLSVRYAKETNNSSILKEKSAKVAQLNNELKTVKLENQQLAEKNSKLVESVRANKENGTNLKENISRQTAEVKTLTENVNTLKAENSKLQEQLEANNKEYSQKLEAAGKNIEKIKSVASKIVERYIVAKANTIGSTREEIEQYLPENYSLDDIDKAAEKIQGYQLNMNKLPFQTSKLNENMKVAMVNQKRDPLIYDPSCDDEVDEQLLHLAGLH